MCTIEGQGNLNKTEKHRDDNRKDTSDHIKNMYGRRYYKQIQNAHDRFEENANNYKYLIYVIFILIYIM